MPDTRLVPLLEQGVDTVTFTLDTVPDQVGVDPFLLLIDRVPADNLKRWELQAELVSRCEGGINRLHPLVRAEKNVNGLAAFGGAPRNCRAVEQRRGFAELEPPARMGCHDASVMVPVTGGCHRQV